MLPFRIQHLDHVVVRVSDLERSIRFYQDVVGCTVDRVRDDLGLVHMRAGTALVDLVDIEGKLGKENAAPTGTHNQNMDHFCLRIEPFDEEALKAHLEAAGIKELRPAENRYGAEGTGPSIYFLDPDGNKIEFKGPSDESKA